MHYQSPRDSAIGAATSSPILELLGGALLALLVFSGQVKETALFAWSPVDLTAAASVLVAFFMVISTARQGLPARRVWLPAVLWLVFAFPLFYTILTPDSTNKIQLLFTVTFLLAVAPFLLLRTLTQVRGFILGTVVLGIAAAYLVANAGATVAGFDSRFYLEGADTISTARLAAAAGIVCILWGLAAPATRIAKFGVIALGAVLFAVAFASGSRGPVLGAAIALFLLIVIAAHFRGRRLKVILTAGLAAAATASVASVTSGDGFNRIVSYVSGEEDASTFARDLLSAEAWRIILETPFGIGWGNFYFGSGLFGYPHNTYLEVTAEGGWIAGLLFLGIVLLAAVRYLQLEPTVENLVLYGLFIFAALNAAVSSNLIGNRLLIVLMFVPFAASVLPRQARVWPRNTSVAKPATKQL